MQKILKYCLVKQRKKWRVLLYNAPGLTYLTYCSTVWHHEKNANIVKLQKLKRGARIITGSNYIKNTEALKLFNWDLLTKIIDQRNRKMRFKALQGLHRHIYQTFLTFVKIIIIYCKLTIENCIQQNHKEAFKIKFWITWRSYME